jgi:hypothetical protein
MSRGISWRQRNLLRSLLRLEKVRTPRGWEPFPVAWCELDYGPTEHMGDNDYFGPRVQWNIEQATRRALRSLEARGLVELGQYSFRPYAGQSGLSPQIEWHYRDPDEHVPGQSRFMTGVVLTEAGRSVSSSARRSGKAEEDEGEA